MSSALRAVRCCLCSQSSRGGARLASRTVSRSLLSARSSVRSGSGAANFAEPVWDARRSLVRNYAAKASVTPSFGSPSAVSRPGPPVEVEGRTYARDEWTNATPTVLSRVERRLHLQPSHPIGILRDLIESHFSSYTHLNSLSPIVTPKQNFDDLGFSADHPGRAKTDTYYLNADAMLRTHTSAHEVETFAKGEDAWLLTADVYRRDEIDSSHYPVFHQMEGAEIFTSEQIKEELPRRNAELEERLRTADIVIEDESSGGQGNPYQVGHRPEDADEVVRHLKNSLNSLVLELFGGRHQAGSGHEGAEGTKTEPLRVRWIDAYFPFTSPSYEVEVFYQGKWLEILGCGVIQQATLDRAGVPKKMGWAFGLGLERIAMVLFSIPDIRLFWSQDPRFLRQFSQPSTASPATLAAAAANPNPAPGGHAKSRSKPEITTFKPFSVFPPCYKDVSFWVPDGFHENDFFEVVRDVAGDLAEETKLIDEFVHPKTQRRSLCYRINYRAMDRSLENEEVNVLQKNVLDRLVAEMGLELR